jgi:prefoldin beta subunit
MESENLTQLQLLRQNLENISLQKQQIESDLTEINSALSVVGTTKQSYKIIGKIMVATTKDQLENELKEKKEVADIRLKNFISQEEKIKSQMENLQAEVVKELEEQKNE